VLEKNYIKKIRQRLEEAGYLVHKTAERFSKGWPDLIAVGNYKVLFIEVKTEVNKLSALQEDNLFNIAKHNGLAYVARMKKGQEILSMACSNNTYIPVAGWHHIL